MVPAPDHIPDRVARTAAHLIPFFFGCQRMPGGWDACFLVRAVLAQHSIIDVCGSRDRMDAV